MSKAPIYMTARSGGRSSKSVLANALEHFISTGRFAGSHELAAEIANYGLERRWAVGILVDGQYTVVTKLGS